MIVSGTGFRERITVLMRRERATRFAGGALGYLWAYMVPVAWIGAVVIAFQFLNRQAPIHQSAELFVATGILPYAMMRQTVTSLTRSVIAYRYLVYVQPVRINEIALASALLEMLNTLLTSVAIFAGITLVFGTALPFDAFAVGMGLLLAWGLGAGFGALVAALGRTSDTFARAVPLVLRPMFWISGIFYSATELATPVQQVLWWNPLFHCIEIAREGYFYGYHSPISEPLYPAVIALALFAAAGVAENIVERTKTARHRI